jgi:predicted amidohydrolase
MLRAMRAHLVQMDLAWEDRAENHRRLEQHLRGVPGLTGSGDLVVLPEMFDTGFSFQLAKTADTDGRTLGFLCGTARRFGVTLHGSRTVVGADGRGRNRATVAGPDGAVLVEYDKVHPFSFGREGEFFTGGDRVVTYPWRAGGESVVVCPAICYDLRFPELFRRGMLAGAEVFALGANWPKPRKEHRRALSIARAIENQGVVLSVNRAGKDPHLEYAGGSIAVGPVGEVLAVAGEEEGVVTVEVDVAGLRAWRAKFPAWKDAKLL